MKSAILAKYDEVESGDEEDGDDGHAAVVGVVSGKKERKARKQATAQDLAMAVRRPVSTRV